MTKICCVQVHVLGMTNTCVVYDEYTYGMCCVQVHVYDKYMCCV